jgi:hypothetical protein
VGVTAFDSTGAYIISGLQRDKYYRSEDGISIMLDTYNDKSHALLFYSNIAGARFDEEVISNGDEFNAAYNTYWDVKTQLFRGGHNGILNPVFFSPVPGKRRSCDGIQSDTPGGKEK